MIKCTFENGHPALLRHVTLDGIVVKEGKILLVKRAEHLVEGGKYCLPGGYLDRDETVTKAVKREVKEETGYDTTSAELFLVKDQKNRPGDDRQNVAFIFIVTIAGIPSEHDQESTEVTWFPLDKLPSSSEIAFDHAQIIEQYKSASNGKIQTHQSLFS